MVIISGISLYTNRCLCILFSKQFLLVVISGNPRRQTHSGLFSKRFYWLFLWVAVSGIRPSTNLIFLILASSNFDWLNYGIFGNFLFATYEWEVYIRMGHFEKTKTTETEKEEKKGEGR